jgi:hypothetical protein
MGYYRYADRDEDFGSRFRDACKGKRGFAWGAFVVGLLVGVIIF